MSRGRIRAGLDGRTRPQVDVLVVGLGVTGVGVALDAVARGLSVLAVDAHDLAFGTSRWSSKLVHGGLRYLANGQVGVAHESAVERGILMEVTAPHLTHALPDPAAARRGTPAVGRPRCSRAGVGAGDLLRIAARTSRETLPRPRRVSATESRHLAPVLGAERPRRDPVVGRPARGRRPPGHHDRPHRRRPRRRAPHPRPRASSSPAPAPCCATS